MTSISPPSPQDIQRKLSLHTSSRIKASKTTSNNPGHVSGTESDSDSLLTPDVLAHPMGGHSSFHMANSSNPPLSSIAERGSGSGAEDSDEDEPADSGWKTPDNRTKIRNSVEECVLKSGYLWKKGERRKTWKKRWFVLRPAHLAYYKTSAEYQLLRLLDLSDIHSCTPVNLKRHNNTFGLISPNRTFYFQANSAQEVREWVAAIEDARQALLATSTQNSASTPIPIIRPGDERQHQQQQQSIPLSTSHRGGRSLVLSSSPGQLHPVTSSDSEDGSGAGAASNSINTAAAAAGGAVPLSPPPPMQIAQSAPSPTAVNFVLAPTMVKPSSGGPPGSGFGGSSASGAAAAVAAAASQKVILNGYLMKCGSKRRTWRKRWFVLTSERLLYCGSHMDTKPHRVIPFTEILDALEYEVPARHHHLSPLHASGLTSSSAGPQNQGVSSFTDGEDDPASHTFKIVTTTKRNLLLCAPTEEDEIKWLGAIRALIARRSGSGVVPGKTPKGAVVGSVGVVMAVGAPGATQGSSSTATAATSAYGGADRLEGRGEGGGGGGSPPVGAGGHGGSTMGGVRVKVRRPSASGSVGEEGRS